MNNHAYKYTNQVMEYVKEKAGKIDVKDIASHVGVSVIALRRQCVVWREGGIPIPSLRKKDEVGTIKVFEYKDGHSERHIKTESGKWVNLSRYNYNKHFGEVPEGHRIAFKDGNALNCDPENLHTLPSSEYFSNMAKRKNEIYAKSEKNKHKSKRRSMPRVSKSKTKGTTSNKRKPGDQANWTQKHLMEEKVIRIPEPPKGAGIRLDSRTVVFPKTSNPDVEMLRRKYTKNMDLIKEGLKSYAANDF